MTNSLVSIVLTCLLSSSALMVVLFRVSPLTASGFALPFFFLSIFFVLASFAALLLSVVKGLLTHQPMRSRAIVGTSLRQGVFFAAASCLIIFLYLLRILNWWIALLIYAVCVLVEMAVSR